MTDDEKAQAVQEALSGVYRCHRCNRILNVLANAYSPLTCKDCWDDTALERWAMVDARLRESHHD